MTQSIKTIFLPEKICYAKESNSVVKLSVVRLRMVMLNIIILNVVMLKFYKQTIM
jgi:hypothetical protein